MAEIDTRYYSDDVVIRVTAGATLNADNSTITVVDSNGDAVDLSGYDSGKLLVKNNLSDADADAVLSFDTAADPAELVLQDGSFYLVKSASDMSKPPSSYKFAMKVKSGVVEIPAVRGTMILDVEGVD